MIYLVKKRQNGRYGVDINDSNIIYKMIVKYPRNP